MIINEQTVAALNEATMLYRGILHRFEEDDYVSVEDITLTYHVNEKQQIIALFKVENTISDHEDRHSEMQNIINEIREALHEWFDWIDWNYIDIHHAPEDLIELIVHPEAHDVSFRLWFRNDEEPDRSKDYAIHFNGIREAPTDAIH